MSEVQNTSVTGLEEFSSAQLAEVDKIITDHAGKPGALIPVLEHVQEYLGYLPQAIQQRVAKGLNIPIANVYGVVTFYSFFTMVPRGKHIVRVCFGTACYVRGAQQVLDKISATLGIKPGGCTEDRNFSLETVRCVGACGLAPVMLIDEDTHAQVNAEKIDGILAQYK